MRDLSQIERELREYERKIQRLKQLERELNSLDTKDFENEVCSTRSKIKDPDKVNQVEKEISKLKQKIEVKERRTKEAVKAIDTAKSTLQKAKSFNLAVSDAERLLNEAKSLLGKGDYITAIQHANKSKGIAETEIDKKFKQSREETLNAISKAQSTLQNVKKIGINTKKEEEKLNNAKRKLDEKDFSNATKLANQCKNSLEQKINEYKKAAERSAKQSLDFAYSKMKEAEKLGINVSDTKDLHKKAISEFDNREYEKAIEYAEKCKKAAEDEISRYNHVKEQISASKDIIKGIKKLTSIPKAEELVEKAESALKVGNYDNAVKFAKQAEGEALRVKKDYEAYKETVDFIFPIESEITKIKSSGVKIPKSEELIEQAKSELNKNNFERAKELAEKAKRIAYERKSGYDLVLKLLSEAERILKETKNKGVIISSDLLTKSKQAFDNGDYEGSVRSAEELKNLVNNRETKYREARDWIKTAKFAIEKAKEFGCDVLDVEDSLKRVERLFEEGAYKEVINGSKRIGERTKKIREESKPEIKVNLSQTSFKPNKWERIDLTIKNRGTATAKAIHVGYPEGRVEIEGLRVTEELKPNEEKSLKITFRAKQEGEVPLTAKITYRDLENKEYTEEQSFWVRVGEEPPRRERESETPTEQKEVTIERAIYDSCKRDFIERALPRMKEWINRYDPDAYWFAVSIQNNTDTTIEEWGVELETSSLIKIKDAQVEGIEYDLKLHETHPVPYKNTYAIGLSKEYGIVIPNGGAQRVYFKLHAEKPKTVYEITGVFKSRITGDIPIRAKKFKYWCDAGMPPEAVKSELKKTFSEKEAAMLALSFKTVQELDRMCNQDAKTEEYTDKILTLKNYTESFSENFTKQVDEFSRFMEQEQMGYLEDEYKGKVRRFCTNLVDVWISEFLKG